VADSPAPFIGYDATAKAGPLQSFSVGGLKVWALREFVSQPLAQIFFPQLRDRPLPHDAWYAQEPHFGAGRLRLTRQAHLIDAPEGWVLIDAASGNEKVRPNNPTMHNQERPWLEQLAWLGLTPLDVSLVVFTHLHCDHTGFATALGADGNWEPTFPNARYVVSRPEWDYWTSRDTVAALERTGDHLSDTVRPLRAGGLLDLVDPESRLTEAISLIPAFGHTPGNVIVQASSLGGTAWFVGDMVHSALQFAFPEWSTAMCVDPAEASRARLRLLRKAAESDLVVVPAHFPAPTALRVRRDGDAFAFDFKERDAS
jgi:glyoxylase-like metal-dependent hydrolase (beta-lactamase superfamily II)